MSSSLAADRAGRRSHAPARSAPVLRCILKLRSRFAREAGPFKSATFDRAAAVATTPRGEERENSKDVGRPAAKLAMQPADAASIDEMFTSATPCERVQILRSPRNIAAAFRLRGWSRAGPAGGRRARTGRVRPRPRRLCRGARRCAAPAGLGRRTHRRGPHGELLACAAKLMAMPSEVFQRVVMCLKPEWSSR